MILPKRTLDLEASSSQERDQWVQAFLYLKDLMQRAAKGVPFNVKHLTHVDNNLQWSGIEDFELIAKLGEVMI